MAYIDKLLNKFNKAKSAVNSIKGITSKIQSINYETTMDSLGDAQKMAEQYIDARRSTLEESIKNSSNSMHEVTGGTPPKRANQLVYPVHERLDNYLLFKIRPRRARADFTNHPVHSWRTVALYVPDAIISQAAVQYRSEGVSTFSRGAVELLDNLTSAESIKDFFSIENGEVVKKLATKAVQNARNAATGGLSNIRFGRASTPLQEQMLDGVPFRSWDFTFDFWPKSALEAEEVNKIIYAFRSSMLPDVYGESFDFAQYSHLEGDETKFKEIYKKATAVGGSKEVASQSGDTNSSYFNYPNVFEISFNGKMGKKVDGFLPAVCTNAQVDYTGGQKFSTFADGQPVHIQLTLNFLEIKTMTLGNYEATRGTNGFDMADPSSTFNDASSGKIKGENQFEKNFKSWINKNGYADVKMPENHTNHAAEYPEGDDQFGKQ